MQWLELAASQAITGHACHDNKRRLEHTCNPQVRHAMAELGATHAIIGGHAYRILHTKRHVGNTINTWMQLAGWDQGATTFETFDLAAAGS
jgi:hypothetical protein